MISMLLKYIFNKTTSWYGYVGAVILLGLIYAILGSVLCVIPDLTSLSTSFSYYTVGCVMLLRLFYIAFYYPPIHLAPYAGLCLHMVMFYGAYRYHLPISVRMIPIQFKDTLYSQINMIDMHMNNINRTLLDEANMPTDCCDKNMILCDLEQINLSLAQTNSCLHNSLLIMEENEKNAKDLSKSPILNIISSMFISAKNKLSMLFST